MRGRSKSNESREKYRIAALKRWEKIRANTNSQSLVKSEPKELDLSEPSEPSLILGNDCTLFKKPEVMAQIQNLKISKTLLNKKDGSDNSSINVNYSPIMIVSTDNSATAVVPSSGNNTNSESANEIQVAHLYTLMWTLLESLPEPKLKNLRYLAVATACDKFKVLYGASKKTAEYLKLKRTYIARLKREINEGSLNKVYNMVVPIRPIKKD